MHTKAPTIYLADTQIPEALVTFCERNACVTVREGAKAVRVRLLLEQAATEEDGNGRRLYPVINNSWAPSIARELIRRQPHLSKYIATRKLGTRGPNKASACVLLTGQLNPKDNGLYRLPKDDRGIPVPATDLELVLASLRKRHSLVITSLTIVTASGTEQTLNVAKMAELLRKAQ